MKQKFKYYLHDTYNGGESRAILERQGVKLSEVAWADMGRPFYEIALDCEVDDKGKVTILGIAKD